MATHDANPTLPEQLRRAVIERIARAALAAYAQHPTALSVGGIVLFERAVEVVERRSRSVVEDGRIVELASALATDLRILAMTPEHPRGGDAFEEWFWSALEEYATQAMREAVLEGEGGAR